MTELKPCPFCGGDDLSLDNLGDDNSWNIECNNCDMGQHAVHTELGAIAAWNTRTTDTELTRLKRQVEVLSRGLRGLRETTTDNISEVRAENALAAADRIAKGEV